MKKQTKIILSVFILLAVVTGGLFTYLQKQEIPVKPVTEIKEQTSEPVIQEIVVLDVEEEPKPEPKEEKFVETEPNDPEKRIIVKYTEPLPPEPSEDEAKYGFPDVNNNKVRDDIEILIVEEFEDDAMVVEAFFADARTREYGLFLARENLLTQENIKKNLDYARHRVHCEHLLLEPSYKSRVFNFTSEARELIFSKNYYNNLERKKYLRDQE